MIRRIDDAELWDYVEGELPDDARSALEARMGEDPREGARIRERIRRMTALRSRLASLPTSGEPARDLWGGIASRIGDASGADDADNDGTVISLDALRKRRLEVVDGAADPSPRDARRVSLSFRQLAAAAVVLAFLSGGGVWMALQGGAGVAGVAGVATGADVPVRTALEPGDAPAAAGSNAPATAVASTAAFASYERAAADLERALESGRDVLAPETLATIEASLASIDRAIQDARDALAADPGSELVNRALVRSMRKKIDVLRQATAAVTGA